MSRIFENEWPSTKKAEYFKIFAERVIELTDHGSLDSYKVHALSTLLKVRELQVVCARVLDKNVPKRVLEPIISEVCEAIRTDEIVKIILNSKGIEPNAILPTISESTEEIASRMSLAESLIESTYQKECERQIIDNCVSEKSKYLLLVLAKLYVAHLCSSGFHRRFVFEVTAEHFTKRRVGRCTKQFLEKYFETFRSKQNKEHNIVLCGRSGYINFLNRIFGFKVFKDVASLKKSVGLDVPAGFMAGKDKLLLTLPQLEAVDPHSAVVQADGILGISRSFLFVYSSSLKEVVDDEVIVFSGKSKKCRRISRKAALSISSSKSTRPSSLSGAAKSFRNFAFDRSLHQSGAGDVLFRALNAASLANNSRDPQAQLVTLWSAFEALLPPPTKDETKTARIVHFSKLIVPALSVGYLASKYEFFVKGLSGSHKSKLRKFLDTNYDGNTPGEQLARALAKGETDARQIAALFPESPLLINRVSSLFAITHSPQRAIGKLEAHEDRLYWQVHRIYRERNEIVHAGSYSPFLVPVVENAFFYFRVLAHRLEATFSQFGVAEPHSALLLIAAKQSQMKSQVRDTISSRKFDDQEKISNVLHLVFSGYSGIGRL